MTKSIAPPVTDTRAPRLASKRKLGRPQPVWVDPVFADRLPGALAEMRGSVCRIASMEDTGDVHAIHDIAGQLTGAAFDFGLEAVADLARSLDGAAVAGDATKMVQVALELCWYLDRVPVIYRQRETDVESLSGRRPIERVPLK